MVRRPQSGATCVELAAILSEGSTAPSKLVTSTLERIERREDPAVFTHITAERALEEAAASSTRLAENRQRSLLDGIPVAWKDLFDLKDEITHAGSLALKGRPASHDAELVRRLAAAGMITVGKLNLTEFAFSGLGLNPHFGTPVNPWGVGPSRIPGGSSSGAGVAVARGLVPVAIGTDTSGSVRIPAALNGVVGFKPSIGRWPLDGVFPLSGTLDTAGVLSRTVEDAALVDAAARNITPWGGQRKSEAAARILVPENAVWDEMEPEVRANFDAAISRMIRRGISIKRAHLPMLDEVMALGSKYGTLVAIEAHRLHSQRLASSAAEKMDPRVRTRMKAGGVISAESEAILLKARLELIAQMEPVFRDNTFLAFPTVPISAPYLDPLEKNDELFTRTNQLMLRNTLIGSVLGWCAISIPNGLNADGLPTSFQLCGGPGKDDALLTAGIELEPAIRGTFSYELPALTKPLF